MSIKVITISLDAADRDFVLEYIGDLISSDLTEKLEKAELDKEGLIHCLLSEYDLDELIGNLSQEDDRDEGDANHHRAHVIAKQLETYEGRLHI